MKTIIVSDDNEMIDWVWRCGGKLVNAKVGDRVRVSDPRETMYGTVVGIDEDGVLIDVGKSGLILAPWHVVYRDDVKVLRYSIVTEDDVKDAIVIGTLPVYLAALTKEFWAVRRDFCGRGFSMNRYIVTKVPVEEEHGTHI